MFGCGRLDHVGGGGRRHTSWHQHAFLLTPCAGSPLSPVRPREVVKVDLRFRELIERERRQAIG